MTLEQIKKALADGKKVYWSNKGYEVIKDNIGQYLIIWDRGGKGEYCIGLTWLNGLTLNGKEQDFFTSL